MRLTIGYKKVWGVTILVLGVVNLALSLLSGHSLGLALGGLFLLVGILYLIMPAVVVEDNAILGKNLFGMTLRTTTFDDMKQIVVEGNQLFVERQGEERARVKGLSPMMIDSLDWERLLREVEKGGGRVARRV